MPKISDPGRFAPAAASALATAGLLLLTGSRLLLLTRLSESGRPAWPVLLPAFFALFLALAALPRLALARGEVRLTLLAAPLAALALFVRAAVLEGLTYDYSTFLSRWAAFFRETGFAGLGQPVGDYNVPYLYFMALIAKIPANDLYLIKLLSIVFDVLLAWAGMLVCARLQERGFGAPADRRARGVGAAAGGVCGTAAPAHGGL